ncbi:hypothetical protein ABW21_db0203845 [Orbilia brochopaga]|nr:hypothetical protein ABW21_db0203845 [Drechslerella brochopaga]
MSSTPNQLRRPASGELDQTSKKQKVSADKSTTDEEQAEIPPGWSRASSQLSMDMSSETQEAPGPSTKRKPEVIYINSLTLDQMKDCFSMIEEPEKTFKLPLPTWDVQGDIPKDFLQDFTMPRPGFLLSFREVVRFGPFRHILTEDYHGCGSRALIDSIMTEAMLLYKESMPKATEVNNAIAHDRVNEIFDKTLKALDERLSLESNSDLVIEYQIKNDSEETTYSGIVDSCISIKAQKTESSLASGKYGPDLRPLYPIVIVMDDDAEGRMLAHLAVLHMHRKRNLSRTNYSAIGIVTSGFQWAAMRINNQGKVSHIIYPKTLL